jgi:hypothetical protein
MPEFMLLLRGGNEEIQNASPEQLQQHVNTYFVWIEKLIVQGQFKSGQPLDVRRRMLAGRQGDMVTDGPFPESKETIGGYFLIEAADFEAACDIARGCPVLADGGTIEVRPIANAIMNLLKEKLGESA